MNYLHIKNGLTENFTMINFNVIFLLTSHLWFFLTSKKPSCEGFY